MERDKMNDTLNQVSQKLRRCDGVEPCKRRGIGVSLRMVVDVWLQYQ